MGSYEHVTCSCPRCKETFRIKKALRRCYAMVLAAQHAVFSFIDLDVLWRPTPPQPVMSDMFCSQVTPDHNGVVSGPARDTFAGDPDVSMLQGR